MITLNIVSSGGSEEADCLVGPASIVELERGASNRVTRGGRPFRLYEGLCVLTVGQEEVADLNYVTRAYHCLRLRCPLNLFTIDTVRHGVFKGQLLPCGWQIASLPFIRKQMK